MCRTNKKKMIEACVIQQLQAAAEELLVDKGGKFWGNLASMKWPVLVPSSNGHHNMDVI